MAFELRTGDDPNGPQPDVLVQLSPEYVTDELWFDPDPNRRTAPVDPGRTDAVSVLLHEIGHALGFSGWIDQVTGEFPSNFQSLFDSNIVRDGEDFFFIGEQAQRQYGGPVPLTFGNPGHLGNESPRPGGQLVSDVMNGITLFRGTRYSVSQLDLAILQDLGLPVTGQPIATAATQIQAGDADQDFDFDQLDLVRVQLTGKYLTRRDATWGEGDWNAAPQLLGDGVFDQRDIMAALGANSYLTGPYAGRQHDRNFVSSQLALPGGATGIRSLSESGTHREENLVSVPEPDGILLVLLAFVYSCTVYRTFQFSRRRSEL